MEDSVIRFVLEHGTCMALLAFVFYRLANHADRAITLAERYAATHGGPTVADGRKPDAPAPPLP